MDTAYRKGESKGRAEGRAEGSAEGRAEGRAEERLANARSLKDNGVPLEVIIRSLSLDDDEISRLV